MLCTDPPAAGQACVGSASASQLARRVFASARSSAGREQHFRFLGYFSIVKISKNSGEITLNICYILGVLKFLLDFQGKV